MKKIVVMKFGGASVATPDRFSLVAEIIRRRLEDCSVVVVVSAMGKTTDSLLDLAKAVHPNPPPRELDMLLSIGERMSIALLAMALHLKGCEAVSFTGSQSGIMTTPEHSDARIIDVRPKRVKENLEAGKVVIVAGFQGVSLQGEITTLGRGGSDTTAVALGIALGADLVEFYKDVPGVFSEDPKECPDTQFLPKLSYEGALSIVGRGAKILHPRCLKLAQKNEIPIHVRSFEDPDLQSGTGTQIGPLEKKPQKRYFYEDEGFFPLPL